MRTICRGCGKDCETFGFLSYSSCCATGTYIMEELSGPKMPAGWWDDALKQYVAWKSTLHESYLDDVAAYSAMYGNESAAYHAILKNNKVTPKPFYDTNESNWECLVCGFKTGIVGDRGPEDGMFKMMRRAFLLHECKAPLEAAGKILDVPWQVTQPAYDLLWEQFGGDTPQETLTNALNYAMKKRSEDFS